MDLEREQPLLQNPFNDSDFIARKMHKDNLRVPVAPPSPCRSSYRKDYQATEPSGIRFLHENLASQLLEAKEQKKSNSPNMFKSSHSKTIHDQKPIVDHPFIEKKKNNYSLFSKAASTNKSVYQLEYSGKRVHDDTVRPQIAPGLMPKNVNHFRGQSTYDMEFTVLPKINRKQDMKGKSKDHLNGSVQLSREVFRTMCAGEKDKPEKPTASRYKVEKAPHDNTHFFPQRISFHGMFISSYQKTYEKGLR